MITSQDLIDLNRQFSFDFNRGFTTVTSNWAKKARKVGSKTFENVYAFHPDLPEMRKWVGDRVVRRLTSHSVKVANDPYELTIDVDRRDIEYDMIGQYADRFSGMGAAGARWYDKVLTDAQLANPICIDGQNFYDTDHPYSLENSGLGTYANAFTNRPLTGPNIWYLAKQMMAFKDSMGKSLELVPDLLEVPTQLSQEGAEAIREINTIAVVKNVAGTEVVAAVPSEGQRLFNLQLLINPKLDGQPLFYYLHSTNRMMPFILQVAKDPTSPIAFMDPKDPNVFWQRKYVWGMEAEGAAAPTLPFLSIRAKTTA